MRWVRAAEGGCRLRWLPCKATYKCGTPRGLWGGVCVSACALSPMAVVQRGK